MSASSSPASSPASDSSSKELKNAGEHKVFDTGARRDTSTNRGRYDLISPTFLKRLAIHLEKGAAKYTARNWEKGIPLHRCAESLLRHFLQWLNGENDEDHLAAVSCNIMFLIHLSEKISSGSLPESLLVEMPPDLMKLLRTPVVMPTPIVMPIYAPEIYCVKCQKMNKDHTPDCSSFVYSDTLELGKESKCQITWDGQHYVAAYANYLGVGKTPTKARDHLREALPCRRCGETYTKHFNSITTCKEYS